MDANEVPMSLGEDEAASPADPVPTRSPGVSAAMSPAPPRSPIPPNLPPPHAIGNGSAQSTNANINNVPSPTVQISPRLEQQPIKSWLPKRMSELEEAEIDVINPDDSLFAELLAAYLAQPDFIQARLCQSRLPRSAATRDDVQAVWRVGRHLLQQNFAAARHAHAANTYPTHLRAYMDEAIAIALESTIKLIGSAYSSLRLQRLSEMLAIETEMELSALIERLQWTVSGEFVHPKPIVVAPSTVGSIELSPEKAIAALVDCDIFLEANN